MIDRIISTPEDFQVLLRECKASVKFYVELAHKKLHLEFPMPAIRFDLKGSTAGTAGYNVRNPAASVIRFSATLLRENPEHFLKQTVGHEVAHLLAHFINPDRRIDPHGREWRNVMWAFSLPANRCHSYDTSNVPNNVGKIANRPERTAKIENGVVRFARGAKIIEFD